MIKNNTALEKVISRQWPRKAPYRDSILMPLDRYDDGAGGLIGIKINVRFLLICTMKHFYFQLF